MDNLKKKKQDAKRISLTQKHEVTYLKRIARKFLADVDKNPIRELVENKSYYLMDSRISPRSIARIAKALLLCLKRIK